MDGKMAEWVGLYPKKESFQTQALRTQAKQGNKTVAGLLLFLDTREGFSVFERCCVWVSRHWAERQPGNKFRENRGHSTHLMLSFLSKALFLHIGY